MQVKSFIEEALGCCSIPLVIAPTPLMSSASNFYNYCYNAHASASSPAFFSVNKTDHLYDPENNGLRRPLLPGDLGLDFSTSVSEEVIQKAKETVGVDLFPCWAPDLFATTATLMERSGAYQLLRPIDISYHKNMKVWGKTPKNKDEFVQISIDALDETGREDIPDSSSPYADDPFGVCGVNRYILRLVGLIWANGALNIWLPPEVSKNTDEKDVLEHLAAAIVKQADKANNVLNSFPKFYSNEIDEDLYRKLKEEIRHRLRKRYIREIQRDRSPEHHQFVKLEGDVFKHSYTRYLAMTAINGQFKRYYNDAKPTEDKIQDINRLAFREEEPIGGLLLVLWALDYVQTQWNILRNCEQNLAPFNPLKLTAGPDDPEVKDYYRWWRAALRLMIISDEAGRAIGFSDRVSGEELSMSQPDEDKSKGIRPGLSSKLIWEDFKKGYGDALDAHNEQIGSTVEEGEFDPKSRRTKLMPLMQRTLTRCFDDEFGSVLPKARTSQVGCTIRSLSHNLALLPPRGRVRARWARSPSGESRQTLNVLMVPFPYELHTRDFKVSETSKTDHAPWGSFNVYPGWLYGYDVQLKPLVAVPITKESKSEDPEQAYWRVPKKRNPKTRELEPLFTDVGELKAHEVYARYIDSCHNKLLDFVLSLTENLPPGDINAIVFPEASLSYAAFEHLAKELPKHLPDLEILVAGLSSAPHNLNPLSDSGERVEGNFVATYVQDPNTVREILDKIRKKQEDEYDPAEREADEIEFSNRIWQVRHIRGKHHRWRLDKEQLSNYALSHTLRPDRDWWENFDFQPREMLFSEFSSGSVMTALICEDLARIEPCQVALRAVGPNLVLVLLMDSAQITSRWPHQYAGVLADDPGSSVLTLTSFGLIQRSTRSMDFKSRSIGMWREPNGRTKELNLPRGDHAILLTLRSEFTMERTLDSRTDNGDSAIVWRFAGMTPIRSNRADQWGSGHLNQDFSLPGDHPGAKLSPTEYSVDNGSRESEKICLNAGTHRGGGSGDDDSESAHVAKPQSRPRKHALPAPPDYEFPE